MILKVLALTFAAVLALGVGQGELPGVAAADGEVADLYGGACFSDIPAVCGVFGGQGCLAVSCRTAGFPSEAGGKLRNDDKCGSAESGCGAVWSTTPCSN